MTLLAFDHQLFLTLHEALSHRLVLWFFFAITWLGHGLVLALLIVPLMAWRDRPSLRTHLLPMIIAVATTGAVTNIAKIIVGRERPAVWAAQHALQVHTPFGYPSDKSFPSGHAQTAFGTAVYLSLLYPKATPLFLTLACLVGLSRISLGAHFPGDVVVGALIGSFGSWIGYRWVLRKRSKPSPIS
ncbi:MAG TPA: phosphatase PAP2 family protein [Polyangiaceae bacterium]|mgnify:CR=1 FL=1|jgi:undecaprenyl-diphosphatase|nr:MAG: undecaprenyl pyrophosphate phosphatase [Deltaproteobacteria bacterium ADurb.Bin207]HNT00010.1 phosphatase PAP2 family protein [Polyangiaceae bacterium]HNZ25082.1 phosphatase PAP2 family protein [Polyangiaceae bacterium]HOD24112.1 phosphatase PAP2 family protein [Polyangiaceae bacterium]HOE50368.1 phosphatase PAP2 family protein [Polyangiaceae bacterium]